MLFWGNIFILAANWNGICRCNAFTSKPRNYLSHTVNHRAVNGLETGSWGTLLTVLITTNSTEWKIELAPNTLHHVARIHCKLIPCIGSTQIMVLYPDGALYYLETVFMFMWVPPCVATYMDDQWLSLCKNESWIVHGEYDLSWGFPRCEINNAEVQYLISCSHIQL